jgi:hypothetical protein
MNEISAFQRYLGYDFTTDDTEDFDLSVEKAIINNSLMDINSLKLKVTLPNIDNSPDQS